ncbi:MAG: LptF/LptG family permease [Pirellulaceae bacterium]
MFIIDRYVLQLFVKVLAICFISFTGLFIIIDAFGNLEEFLDYGAKRGSLVMVMVEYYGARTLSFFDRTSSLLALISAMFVVTWMQRSNELTAVMAAGIPKLRIVKPLIAAAVVVSLLGIVNREFFIPSVREQLSHNMQDPEGTVAQTIHRQYDHRTKIFLNGSGTFFGDKRIAMPRFQLPPNNHQFAAYGRELAAANAYYREAEDGRPAGYLLDVVEHPANLTEIDSVRLRGRDAILSPKDTPWLEDTQCFVVSDVNFAMLTVGNPWKQFSSTYELISGLNNPSLNVGADVQVTIHARLVQPLLDLSLLLLGLPMVLKRESRNIFVSAGLCLVVVAAYFLIVIACHGMGSNYLLKPAALAAWAPLMIFGPVAYAVFRSLRE